MDETSLRHVAEIQDKSLDCDQKATVRQLSWWTKARIETLGRLWAEGLSAGEIANEMRAPSRNSIIGKVHRSGLPKRPRPGAQTTERAPRKSPRKSPKLTYTNLFNSPWESQKTRPVAATPLPEWAEAQASTGDASPSPANVRLCDLRLGQCRWPMWAMDAQTGLFCGMATHGTHSYCAGHCRIAFQPSRKMNTWVPQA